MDNGATWNYFPLGMGSEPSVEVCGNVVYVAYRKWTGEGPDYILRMVITWGYNGDVIEVEFLNPIGAELEFAGIPVIAADGDNIHLMLADYNQPYIYHWNSSDNGGNWSSVNVLAPQDGTVGLGDISLDVNGQNMMLAWTTNNQIYTRTSTDNGANWRGLCSLTTSTGTALNPEIIVDENQDIHLVWQDNRGGVFNTFYMKLDSNGNILIPETRLISTNEAVDPTLTIDGFGYVHLVWQELIDGVWQVCYTRGV